MTFEIFLFNIGEIFIYLFVATVAICGGIAVVEVFKRSLED
jgi:hypothetical protein